VAYAFDSKWDVSSLDELDRRLNRVSLEAAKGVRASNKKHANELQKRIRVATPVAGGTVAHRNAYSRATGPSRKGPGRSGRMRMSVRSRAGADYASVVGGGPGVPYFCGNEFGGGQRLKTKGGRSFYRPMRERSASIKSLGYFDKSGTQRGAAGWFFFPTGNEYMPTIQREAVTDAEAIIRHELSGSIA
jgi:hypothetical protein